MSLEVFGSLKKERQVGQVTWPSKSRKRKPVAAHTGEEENAPAGWGLEEAQALEVVRA